MKVSTALRIVEEVITDELQRIAPQANLCDIVGSRTESTVKASKRRKRIIEAWYAVKLELVRTTTDIKMELGKTKD